MNSEPYQTYKHSGKFGVHGPILAILAAVILGFPLGIAYAYIVRWIPFIYVCFLATLGYGFLFGFITSLMMKFSNVRNNGIAILTGLIVGFIALYLAWSGYIFAMFKGSPWFLWPDQIVANMRDLYEHGSWGMGNSGPVTGVLLAIVWLVEAGMIVGLAAIAGASWTTKTPYCEENQCWLDQSKNIDTLGPFTDPDQRAAFAAGDLSPLTAARPKIPGTENFTRLTLKYSPKCNIFYTVRIEDATITTDKNGNPKTELKSITKDLVLPHEMFDLISKFEHFKGGLQGGGVPPAPPSLAT